MGEDINYQNDIGNTPLHLSIMENNIRMSYLLLIKNCDRSLKNDFGSTPYDVALKKGNKRILGLFKKNNFFRSLMNLGLSVKEMKSKNKFYFTIFFLILNILLILFFIVPCKINRSK